MREIKSADNLVAQVEGDIEDVDGVMRIIRIRLRYRFHVPAGSKEKVDRVSLVVRSRKALLFRALSIAARFQRFATSVSSD